MGWKYDNFVLFKTRWSGKKRIILIVNVSGILKGSLKSPLQGQASFSLALT